MSLEPTLTTFDVAVIGGGITGAGVARDAALRGLSCLLLEKGDFAAGTSSRTTRLVHGGLRYLETGDLHLVAESLRERELLLRMAPHLVHPIPILLPTYEGDRRSLWKIRLGLLLYDILSMGKGTPHYGVLDRRTALRKAPSLKETGLLGAGLFYDYQIPFPERLVLENIFSAREHGAYCLNYHEVQSVSEHADGFLLKVHDNLSGSPHVFTARTVVNAAGPWADHVCDLYRKDLRRKVRPTKGAHIVVDADLGHAVFTASPKDERLFFTTPLEGLTLVGTTDTFWEGTSENVAPDEADCDYLLEGLRKLMPGRTFGRSDILWGYAGLRPLALTERKGAPSTLTRRHVVHKEGPGGRFLTIVGGKYTTFRRMAEDVVDAACRALGLQRGCTTDRVPLFGGGLKDRVIFRENLCECTQRLPDLPRETVEHLVTMYGKRCCDVIDIGIQKTYWREPIQEGYTDVRAQVAYAVREEDAHHLDDVILRRLRMSLSLDLGRSAAEPVARIMGQELGWTEQTIRAEVDAFRERLAWEMALGGPGSGRGVLRAGS